MARLNLQGWLPIRLFERDGVPRIDWCWFGDRRLTHPFFQDDVETALRLPFNQALRQDTALHDLLDWQQTSPGLEPNVFIFHASRCGSTLLAQMLARLDDHVVLSEPPPLDQALRAHYRSGLHGEAQHDAVRAMLSALGQRRAGSERRLAVKLDAWNIFELPLLRRCFPTTPWLFLYRDPLEIAVSHLQQPGMHMIAGMLGASPLNQVEDAPAPRETFIARRLGRLLETAAHLCREHDGLALDYSELPMALDGRLREWLGLDATQVTRALEACGRHAKRPAQAFTADGQRKRAEATSQLGAAIERWADAPYRELERLRLEQGG
ncbi:sulfotransferase family protein [Pseudomonas lopnurensis]|uniref:sulfotransferase family protein n=1 Tax=Pseudomonas lopnurensis TaxID=1477517 RepID=UPI0028AE0829|nr:sulfotransferase family protein [Pseudomonas lopnurensis]